MASEVQDSTNESSFSSGSGNNDSGDFECNICFELAQDPVITLCGHLYCWPCLYRWLRNHSKSHECPVCKALVQEEKLIPLYGRGKNPTDPRTKPIPGFEIPNRPAGQRPETAPPPPPPPYHGIGSFPNISFGLFGGFIPFASASFGNTGLSAGLGGFNFNIPSFGFQGVSNGASSSSAFTDGYGNGVDNSGLMRQQVEADNNLKMLLICIGFAVLYFLLCA